MQIDAMTFREIANAIFPPRATLSRDEAAAITQLAYLGADADLDEDDEERALRDQLGRYVCDLAGISFEDVPRPSPLPLPIDDEARLVWIERVSGRLRSEAARELAYVVVYLLVIGDLELAPVETVFVSELQRALDLSDTRAAELIAYAAELVTPREVVGRWDDSRHGWRA